MGMTKLWGILQVQQGGGNHLVATGLCEGPASESFPNYPESPGIHPVPYQGPSGTTGKSPA